MDVGGSRGENGQRRVDSSACSLTWNQTGTRRAVSQGVDSRSGHAQWCRAPNKHYRSGHLSL